MTNGTPEASPLIKEIIKNVIQTLMTRSDGDLQREAGDYTRQLEEVDEMNHRMLKQLERLGTRIDRLEKSLETMGEPLDIVADELDLIGTAVQTWMDKGGKNVLQLAAIYAGLRAESEAEAVEGEEEEGETEEGEDDDRPRRGE